MQLFQTTAIYDHSMYICVRHSTDISSCVLGFLSAYADSWLTEVTKSERETEREKERQSEPERDVSSTSSLFRCHSGQGWAKVRPGIRRFLQVSYVSAGPQAHGLASAFPRHASREMLQLEQLGL